MHTERKLKFARSEVEEISKRVLRTMKTKIEIVIEGEMETIMKLKYQNATEMFRKIQTTPLINDEKIMNFPGNVIQTLILRQTTIQTHQITHSNSRLPKYEELTSIF